MKAKELQGRNADDLRGELAKLQKQLFQIKLQWQSEENPDTSQHTKLRRDIARVMTALRALERPATETKTSA